MKRLFVPLEMKTMSDKGLFTGYASIFGNQDEGGDVVVGPAPFTEIVRDRNGKVRVLFMHDYGGYTPSAGLPIGTADVEQNEKGLLVDGTLAMFDPFVKDRIYPHMKEGTLDGMSIGYDTLRWEYDEKNEARRLLEMKLWEVTVCTFGMNQEARVEAVKSRAKNVTNIREFEDLLRDVGGFSSRQAKLLAAGGWGALQKTRDESGGAGDVGSIVKLFESYAAPAAP